MSKRQNLVIFTTASLPWMTGTAVNPLFRAAYLSKDDDLQVTLVIPWISLKDQGLVYPNNITFSAPAEQESYIRNWVEERIDFKPTFKVIFYPGKFSKDLRSIFPSGDITQCVPDEDADIAVLEEPEHLTWYHHGRKWKSKFKKVIGIVHTNYLEYVKREKNGKVIAFVLRYANSWVTRIYCHKIIRLSAATQNFPRSVVCNVHGVNPKFIEIGKVKQGQILRRDDTAFTKGAYYIGKMVWSKGYRELLQLLSDHEESFTEVQFDLFGSGEDWDQVNQSVKKLKIDIRVYPGRDHVDPLFHDYKVFVNPSTSDVVCTTTSEALAMGKTVICRDHPSNEFFKQFPNCLLFRSGDEFANLTLQALSEGPSPLTDEHRHELSWEAATERFMAEAEINQSMIKGSRPATSKSVLSRLRSRRLKKGLEELSVAAHQAVSGIETARRVFGAEPKSLRPDEELCRDLGLGFEKKKSRWRR